MQKDMRLSAGWVEAHVAKSKLCQGFTFWTSMSHLCVCKKTNWTSHEQHLGTEAKEKERHNNSHTNNTNSPILVHLCKCLNVLHFYKRPRAIHVVTLAFVWYCSQIGPWHGAQSVTKSLFPWNRIVFCHRGKYFSVVRSKKRST